MARNDLLRQLIASPHALPPPQPRNLIVSPQGSLPPQARFGPMSPGQVTNSPFSGAVPQGGPMNLVHPAGPADFQAPRYSPLTPVGPARSILTALAPIVGATLMGGSGATAGIAPTAIPAPPPPPGAGLTPRTQIPLPAGYQGASVIQGPPKAAGTFPAGGLGGLIASLAGQGQKVNPSRGGNVRLFV